MRLAELIRRFSIDEDLEQVPNIVGTLFAAGYIEIDIDVQDADSGILSATVIVYGREEDLAKSMYSDYPLPRSLPIEQAPAWIQELITDAKAEFTK